MATLEGFEPSFSTLKACLKRRFTIATYPLDALALVLLQDWMLTGRQ